MAKEAEEEKEVRRENRAEVTERLARKTRQVSHIFNHCSFIWCIIYYIIAKKAGWVII